MSRLMRCLFCGQLQDEPQGVKACARCGGELAFEGAPPPEAAENYLTVQMELDQVVASPGYMTDRHLIVTVRAPKDLPPDQILANPGGRPALNFAAVLDVSGSMAGDKLANAKEALRQALVRLHDGDALSLTIFSDEARSAMPPVELNDQMRQSFLSAVQEMRAGGMTALDGGLGLGIQHATRTQRPNNLVLLLSDGQANVGETDLERVGLRARQARQSGMVVSTLGVGMDYNEALMQNIASEGGGRFYHVSGAGQIGAYLAGELGEIASLAARKAELHLSIPPGATLVAFSATYPVRQEKGQAVVSIGDIPCDTELEITLRLTLPGGKPGDRASVEGSLQYLSPVDRRLLAPLNRVTVRFKDPAALTPGEGVVIPVVERVLVQMKAASVLQFSHASWQGGAEAARTAGENVERIRAYASLLGEEAAEKYAAEVDQFHYNMAASPASAKQAVQNAHFIHRGGKDFSDT
jgi:Ca-activated chloride channel homolog